jgi:hypothetical protein
MEFLIPVSVFTEIMRFGKSTKFFSCSIWALDIMEHDALQRATKDYPHPTQGGWIVEDSSVSSFTELLKVYLTFIYEGLPSNTSAIYDYREDIMLFHNANEASAKLNLLPQVEQLEFFKQKANQITGWLDAIWALPKERLTAALGGLDEQSRTNCVLELEKRNLLQDLAKLEELFPELSPKPTQANLQWEWSNQEWALRACLETGEWEDFGYNIITGRIDRRYENYRI